MSFQALAFFSTCKDWQEAEKLTIAIGKEWPFAKHKIIQKPFIGVGAIVDPTALAAAYLQHEDTSVDESELQAAAFGAFEQNLPTFSEKFTGKAFVYMRIDCFAPPCLISGKIFRSGRMVFKQSSSPEGGDQLLFQAGMYAKGSTFQRLLNLMLS